jgi:hypothetical protein
MGAHLIIPFSFWNDVNRIRSNNLFTIKNFGPCIDPLKGFMRHKKGSENLFYAINKAVPSKGAALSILYI